MKRYRVPFERRRLYIEKRRFNFYKRMQLINCIPIMLHEITVKTCAVKLPCRTIGILILTYFVMIMMMENFSRIGETDKQYEKQSRKRSA